MAQTGIFNALPLDAAVETERLSRLIYELRENRRAVLAPYGIGEEAELLEQLGRGMIAEHPAYEHYLAARILADTRDAAREAVAGILAEARRS